MQTTTDFLEWQIQKTLDKMLEEKLEKWQKEQERLRQQMKSALQRVQLLEQEVSHLKQNQQRRFRRNMQDLLKTLRPTNQTWLEWIEEWRDDLCSTALEDVFASSNFLDAFLLALKRIRPILVSLNESVPLPNMITPLVVFQQRKKKMAYIWDADAEVWTCMQYNHLHKMITLYIHRIRTLWLEWQTQNQDRIKESEFSDRYNRYISKPVTILYKESHKTRMIKTLLAHSI